MTYRGAVFDARHAGAGATGRRVRVGVIDSGWDSSISNAQVRRGIGLVDPADGLKLVRSNDTDDRLGHGTVCIGEVLDVAPECSVVPIRVFGSNLETSAEAIIAAIEWAARHRLQVVNLSLGTVREDLLRPLYLACELARRAGVIIVSAVRAGRTQWSYPAVFAPVIGVGHMDLLNPFDIHYREGAAVECRVLSRGRRCRGLGDRALVVSGTSYGAPIVAGLIALWLERWPDLDIEGVRRRMALASGQVTEKPEAETSV